MHTTSQGSSPTPLPRGIHWEHVGHSIDFRHRVVIRGANGNGPTAVGGNWAEYGAVARLIVDGVTYYACTKAYDGVLPTEQIFTVEIVA